MLSFIIQTAVVLIVKVFKYANLFTSFLKFRRKMLQFLLFSHKVSIFITFGSIPSDCSFCSWGYEHLTAVRARSHEAKWTQTGIRFHFGWKPHFGIQSTLYTYSHALRRNETQNSMDFILVTLAEMKFNFGW